jgi:hypothetical protein
LNFKAWVKEIRSCTASANDTHEKSRTLDTVSFWVFHILSVLWLLTEGPLSLTKFQPESREKGSLLFVNSFGIDLQGFKFPVPEVELQDSAFHYCMKKRLMLLAHP